MVHALYLRGTVERACTVPFPLSRIYMYSEVVASELGTATSLPHPTSRLALPLDSSYKAVPGKDPKGGRRRGANGAAAAPGPLEHGGSIPTMHADSYPPQAP